MLDFVVYHHDGRTANWHHCPIGGSLSAALVEMRLVCQSRTQHICTDQKYCTKFVDLHDPSVGHTVVLFCKFGKLISRLKKNRHFWNVVIDITNKDYADLVVRCPLPDTGVLGIVSQQDNKPCVLHAKNSELSDLVVQLANLVGPQLLVDQHVYQVEVGDTWWGILRDPDGAMQQHAKYKKRMSMMAAHHVDHCVVQPEQFVVAQMNSDRIVEVFERYERLDMAIEDLADQHGCEVLGYSDALNSLVFKQAAQTSVFGLLAKHLADAQEGQTEQTEPNGQVVLVDTGNQSKQTTDLVDALYYLAELVDLVCQKEEFVIKLFFQDKQAACMLTYFDQQSFHTAGLFDKQVDQFEKASQDNLFWFEL